MSTLVMAPGPEVLSITFDLKPEDMQGFMFAVTPARLAKKFKHECVIISLSLNLAHQCYTARCTPGQFRSIYRSLRAHRHFLALRGIGVSEHDH